MRCQFGKRGGGGKPTSVFHLGLVENLESLAHLFPDSFVDLLFRKFMLNFVYQTTTFVHIADSTVDLQNSTRLWQLQKMVCITYICITYVRACEAYRTINSY